MIDIVWRPYYDLGIETIDQDHRKLLGIMQDVQAAITEGNLDKSRQLFGQLIEECRGHFSREEAMLEEAGFPHLERHRQYHHNLIEDVIRTRDICEQAQGDADAGECFDNMARFIIDDILRGDLGFKSFMEDAGYIKPTVRIPI